MGHTLIREMRDYAPNGLGMAGYVLLSMVADDADDDTRLSSVTCGQLVTEMRAADWDTVQKVLIRLSRADVELRVPIGVGRDSRFLYAMAGRPLTFYVPQFNVSTGQRVASVIDERREHLLSMYNDPGRPSSRRCDIVHLLAGRDGPACRGCGLMPRDVTTLEVDHYVPRALGGLHTMSNLQLLCGPCNRRKHAKHPDVWRAELGPPQPTRGACHPDAGNGDDESRGSLRRTVT